MTRYRYKAVDAAGKTLSGEVTAASRQEAADALLAQRLTPFALDPLSAGSIKQLSYRDAGRLGSDIARLASSGVPLETGARLAAKAQDSPVASAVLTRAADRLAQGEGATAAFSDLPGAPGRALSAIVKAGDRAGQLAQALMASAPLLTAMARFREKLVSLMLYPVIICITSIGVLIILLTVVIPSLRPVLEDMGEAMPTATRVLLWASDAVPNFLVAILVAALASILLGQITAIRQRFGSWRDRLLLTPLGFGLSKSIDGAVFARLFAALIKAGTPAGEALADASEAVANSVLRQRLQSAAQSVREGGVLSDALADALGADHLVTQASQLGVRGGAFGDLVEEAGHVLAEQAELRLERLAAIAGPGVIIVLGALIALFVVTVFTSLLALTDAATM